MSIKFYGIDLHKKYSTISVLNLEGEEIEFIHKCTDLKGYISKLGKDDYAVIEACTGSFHWADEIESQGATCFIIDPYKFKIIRDSWKKTDKHDARNMSQALWISQIQDRFGLPTVYKPEKNIRELRRLFSCYDQLNKQIKTAKNYIQSILTDDGIVLPDTTVSKLFKNENEALIILNECGIPCAGRICIEHSLELLWVLLEKKVVIKKEIYLAGESLRDKVELLITIKGVTPLLALAFLSDVGDVTRFKKAKQMYAYLGVVPKVKSSGGKTVMGHINRASRKLTRTLCTQSVHHVAKSSEYLTEYYTNLKKLKGAGKARIALIRKLMGIMRRMLLSGEEYRWINKENYERKLTQYNRDMKNIKLLKKCA
jgi:transposase